MIDRKRLLEDLNDYAWVAEEDDCFESVHQRALDYIAELEGKIAAARIAFDYYAHRGQEEDYRAVCEALAGFSALNVTHTLPGERTAFGYTAMASTGDYCGPVTVVVLRREP